MNKKSIGALLLSAALLVGGTASTFAYFTNQTQTGVVSFTTGNVKVQFLPNCESDWMYLGSTTGNSNNEKILSHTNIQNLAPGDKIYKKFVLQNNGSLDAKVRLSLKDMTASSEGTQGYWFLDPEAFKAYTIDDNGDKISDVDLKLEYDADVQGTILNPRIVKYATLDASKDEKIEVELYATINPLMPNGAWVGNDPANGPYNYANHNRQFDLRVLAEATQWNNPGWTEAGTGAN